VPEPPEAFWERAHDALRTPPVEEWETWPFTGPVTPQALQPPVEAGKPRHGAGGVGCHSCEKGTEDSLWSNEHWKVRALSEPAGLPMIAFLETRAHYDFSELPDDLAVELGPLMLKVQRAVFAIGDIGNVHVCRWGDGSEHFHMWFMARPARITQLIGSFAAIWNDVVPPVPDDVWNANVEIVRRELNK
jgi:hypothetical protein